MFRKTVSLTAFVSFLVLLFTSVVLYFEPHGRVAYWGDWHFLWLTKTDWDEIHLVVGTLFVLAILLHIWLNWKPVTAYMKNRARELVVFTPAMAASLAVTLYFTIGAVAGLPGAQQIIDFSAQLKDAQTERYGNPPYGHAELSTLKKFCSILEFDVDGAVQALRQTGIASAAPDSIIADLARSAGMPPQGIYEIIRSALAKDPFAALPPAPPEGTGMLTLVELSRSFGLPMDQLAQRLAAAGLPAAPDMNLKQVAAAGGMTPQDVYKLLRNGQ